MYSYTLHTSIPVTSNIIGDIQPHFLFGIDNKSNLQNKTIWVKYLRLRKHFTEHVREYSIIIIIIIIIILHCYGLHYN